jgi:hypothetical protein
MVFRSNSRYFSVLAVAVGAATACSGSGAANDFDSSPVDDVPTAEGAPGDPNAPPSNPNDPPAGGVAPPPQDGISGTTPVPDCRTICIESSRTCPDPEEPTTVEDLSECTESCADIRPACMPVVISYLSCLKAYGCDFENSPCISSLLAASRCLDPDPDDPGQGGQGNL